MVANFGSKADKAFARLEKKYKRKKTTYIGVVRDHQYLTYFDKVICMKEGEILEFGEIKELINDEFSILRTKVLRDKNDELLKELGLEAKTKNR